MTADILYYTGITRRDTMLLEFNYAQLSCRDDMPIS